MISGFWPTDYKLPKFDLSVFKCRVKKRFIRKSATCFLKSTVQDLATFLI